MKVLSRAWMPLLIVIVIIIAATTVARIRTFFGVANDASVTSAADDDTKPFEPKVVTYEVFGNGTYANINYLDLGAHPQRLDDTPLPWSLTLDTTAPSAFPNIVAQGDGDTITCRITVDDKVKDERTSTGVAAQTFCLVKSA
ncbi:MmpS family transport accessory protein [Mycolicibacterium sp. CBM1]